MKSLLASIRFWPLLIAVTMSPFMGSANADTIPTLFKSFAGNVNFVGTEHTLRTADNNTDACSLVSGATTSAGSVATDATLSGIPSGATIEAAYLYWAGSGATPDYDVTFNGQAVSAAQGRRYTASFTQFKTTYSFFSGVADVTSIVAAEGNGTYSFAGLTVDGGRSSSYCPEQIVLGGWSLLVIYSDPSTEPFRVLNVYEGFQTYQNNAKSPLALTLSNFTIPSTGSISGKVAYITWEGDATISGSKQYPEEYEYYNGSNYYSLTDPPINPPNNIYNSTSSINGDTTSYGIDFDAYTLNSPQIYAGETTGSSIYMSGQDLVFLGAEVLSVPNSPATDLAVSLARNGNLVKGQNASYSVTVTNNGPLDETKSFTVTDTLPTGLTYVSSSGTGWSCSGAPTLTCTYSGGLANGATTPALTLTVAVASTPPTSITNSVSVASSDLFDYVPANNTASDTFTFEADLGISMTNSGNFSVGQNSTFTITVNNNGPLDEPGPITVVDNLPGGLSLISFSGTNWSCSGTTSLTCTYTGAIANGTTATALVITVSPTTSGSFTNSATVTGTQDNNPANNTATNTVGVQVGAYAYYAMEDGSWNGTAGEVKDGSGNGHNGTAVGSAAITTQQGNDVGYMCTGGNIPSDTTSAINTGLNPNTIGNTGTIDFWYKSNTAWNSGNSQDARVLLDASSANYQFFLYLSPNGSLLFSVDTINTGRRGSTTRNNWLWSNSSYSDPANIWVHIAVTWDIGSGNGGITIYRGVDGGATSQIGSLGISASNSAATYGTLYLGDTNPSGYLANTYQVYSANGIIDETRIYNTVLTQSQIQADMDASHPCASTLAQFGINVGSSPASTCVTHAVTITAEDSSGAALPGYTGTVQIGTSSGHGDWSLNTGSGILSTGSADSGSASYTYAASDNGVATFNLADTHADDLYVTASDGTVTTTSSLLSFRDNVFVISPTTCTGSSCASGTPSTVVVAGRPHGMEAALWTRDTAGSSSCSIDTRYNVTGVKGWYTPDSSDPTGAAAPKINDGTNNITLPSSAPAGNNLALNFKNGMATFTLNTTDVGKYTLSLLDDSSSFAKDSYGNARPITGTSNTLTVRPFAIDLRNVQLANGTKNPGATQPPPTGTKFTCAGCDFEATAAGVLYDPTYDTNNDGVPDTGIPDTALNSEPVTPSYAWATTITATTPIWPSAPSPSTPPVTWGGHLGSLANGALPASSFSNGSATAATLQYSEVGSVTLQPKPKSGFLGTSNVDIPYVSVKVGRFSAASLGVSVNTPVFKPADVTFTYLGQEFGFSNDPVLTITGLNAAGNVTNNYDQTYWALSSGLTSRSYAKTSGATTAATLSLSTNGGAAVLSGTTTTDSSGNLIYDGTGKLTISGDKLTYSKPTTPEAPFSADVDLTIPASDLTDSDGACYDPTGTGCTDFTIGGIAGTQLRWGRIAMQNANGSELNDLQVPATAEYYDGSGFTPNNSDNTTSLTGTPMLGLADIAPGTLVSKSLTCVQDPTTPGASGYGCGISPLPATESPFTGKANSGQFALWFRAPGSGTGHTGSITVTAYVPPWLQYPWKGPSIGDIDPFAVVTFGIFQGNPKDIYRRELY